MPTTLAKPPILIEVLVPGTRNEPGNEPPPGAVWALAGEPASNATAAVRLPSAVTALNLRDFLILPPQVSSTYGKGGPSCAVNSAGSARNDKRCPAKRRRIDGMCAIPATQFYCRSESR